MGRAPPAAARGTRRRRGADETRARLRRLAALLRGARRARTGSARVRGPPLGRRRPARLRRRARRRARRGAAARRLHGRPELLARRPGWGGGKRNAPTLSLAPLSDDETARCCSRCSSGASIPRRDAGRGSSSRAGGRAAVRRGVRADARGRTTSGSELPETLQGIVARAARRPPSRGEGAGPGRRRYSARSSGRTRWPLLGSATAISTRCCGRSSGGSSSVGSAARRSRARASTCSSTRSSATLPTARSRAVSGPSCTGSPPTGWSRSSRDARTTERRCSRITCARRSSSAARREPTCRTCARERSTRSGEAGDRAWGLAAPRAAARLYARALEVMGDDEPDPAAPLQPRPGARPLRLGARPWARGARPCEDDLLPVATRRARPPRSSSCTRRAG